MRCYLWITLLMGVALVQLCESEDVTSEALQEVGNGLLKFGLNLHSRLIKTNVENKNLLFSPFNVYIALSFLHLGSNGTTRKQISRVMKIPQGYTSEMFHNTLRNISLTVQKSSKKNIYKDDSDEVIDRIKLAKLNLANAIFVQRNLTLNQTYVDDVRSYYNSEIIPVNFMWNEKEATDTINKYVANQTNDQIPQLLKTPLPSETRMMLISSLYFKSGWWDKFPKKWTSLEDFHTDSGNVTVSMMKQRVKIPYADFPSLGVEAVNLKFLDKKFRMFIVMPYQNQSLNEFLSKLTPKHINTIVNRTSSNYRVDFKLPRTAFKWSKSIVDDLTHLGLWRIFDDRADFSNMIARKLAVKEVLHGTDIKIDEDGTEASAVTGIGFEFRMGGREREATFHVNRPFFFFIYNRKAETVLFYGTVYNPIGE